MLILVRHGQTAINAEGRLQGRVDPDLTDIGRAQAAALATVVAGAARVVSSPARRARDTAALLGLGVDVEVDPRWVEIDYGVLDGLAFHQVPSDVWQRWRTDAAWAPEGGESHDDVGRRVAEACEELLGAGRGAGSGGAGGWGAGGAGGGDVVVVSHVSPIKAAVAWALGVSPTVASRMHLGLASVCRIDMGPHGPVLKSFNETAHLA